MKKEKITFKDLYLHDAIVNGIEIVNFKKTGSDINIFLNIYYSEDSKDRHTIKIIFKSVENLILSVNFLDLFDNQISGNVDLGYIHSRGYVLNLFGGLIHLETAREPKIKIMAV